MAWQDETIPTLRAMIGDMSLTAQTYTDETLESILVVAAKRVATRFLFDQTFVCSVENLTILPDPTVTATKNDSYVNLFTLQAAAILDRTEASLAARRGISVKDGTSAIDLSKVAFAKIKLLEKGWNAVFDQEAMEYQINRTQSVAGAAIMTPFRLYAWENFGTSMTGGDFRNRDNFFN